MLFLSCERQFHQMLVGCLSAEAKRRHEHKRFLANEKGVVLNSTILAVCLERDV